LKLPRDLGGTELAKLLRRYGYEVTRQTGSHLRLTSSQRGSQHHISIPAHKDLRLGTLAGILDDVSNYLQITRADLELELFGG
jgi:predicted RNA binding protein YcfA (HicA-like mRNA interferase family)